MFLPKRKTYQYIACTAALGKKIIADYTCQLHNNQLLLK
jgi:hypothetical protein